MESKASYPNQNNKVSTSKVKQPPLDLRLNMKIIQALQVEKSSLLMSYSMRVVKTDGDVEGRAAEVSAHSGQATVRGLLKQACSPKAYLFTTSCLTGNMLAIS